MRCALVSLLLMLGCEKVRLVEISLPPVSASPRGDPPVMVKSEPRDTCACPAAPLGFISLCEAGVCRVTCAPGLVQCLDRCEAQCERWSWANPPLTANSLYAASFFSASVGVAGGDKLLLGTIDGGAHWSPVAQNL